ncbi:MAG: type II/IV secretion system protein, partial [Thermodesulfobacteriota bacterium]|nr:type II/IV secretion system protein [Thermodesulfobacteriota bacterium]
MTQNMTIDYVCEVLFKRMLISLEQKDTILQKKDNQKKRLMTLREIHEDESFNGGISLHGVSPVDIISSLRLEIPNGKKDKKEFLNEEIIMEAIANDLGFPFKKIDPLDLDLDVVTRTIPRPFAIRNLVIPIYLEDGELKVSMYDPTNTQVIEDIQRVVNGLKVSPVVSTKSDILKIINEFYGFKSSIVEAEKKLMSPIVDLGNLEQYVKLKSVSEIQYTDTHIKNAVDYLLNYAFEQRASDIHIEPKREKSIVRLRIDGILHPIYTLPKI